MKNLQTAFDTVIVGGGFGGLTAALLLANRGEDICLLEGHTVTGGSASCFDRFERDSSGNYLRYRFDVGATTLSGLHEGGPLRRLFNEGGATPPMRSVDPGMIVTFADERRIYRWSDTDKWIAECERVFAPEGQRPFWEHIFRINQRGWNLSEKNPSFPPKSLGDLLRIARPINLRNLDLLQYPHRSVAEEMERYGVNCDSRFHDFLKEQLMITSQNVPSDTPFLVGAMGLAYPSDTWYPEGGMYGVARWLEHEIEGRGGVVRTKRRGKQIRRDGSEWIIETSRENYRAKRVISNLTTWDMAELLNNRGDTIRQLNQLDETVELWGAFTLYVAVQDTLEDGGSLYHQIHSSPLPHIGTQSIFVSLSPSDDRERAPEGWRTITVSTHVPKPEEWERLAADDPEEYERRKVEVGEAMLEVMGGGLPGFRESEKKFLLYGTPRSFAFYTGRRHGRVGGVPHTLRRSLFTTPKYRTRLPNVYLVGDTLYPGQGVPAVVLGALNLVDEIGNTS